MTSKFRIFATLPFFCAALTVAQAPGAAAQSPSSATGAATAALPSPVDPLAAEVLAAAAPLPEIATLYQVRDGAPFWSSAGGPLPAEALVAALETADSHALPAARYGAHGLRARLQEGDALPPAKRAALDVDLTRALAAWGGDLAAGLLRPSKVDGNIHVFPDRPSAALLMVEAEAAPDFAAWLAGLAPTDPGYDRLRDVYAELQREAAAGGWRSTLWEGGTLRRGDAGPRVEQLRARLAELGDAAPVTETPTVFDAGLEQSVKAFQGRHGLNADGLAGRRTFEALGADVGQRLRQVAVNLERMRWAPHDFGPKHILVNQADQTMRLYDGEQVIHSARVVVGQSRHQTPEFTDRMTFLVVNPTWHVPRSIATKEILPALQEDPNYLVNQNMQLVATDGGPVPVDTTTHDWTQYDGGFFPYRVKQRPSGGNALGRVKFMFPNQFSIYLHDTPSKRLFAKDARYFSHGCVRVENPFDLAYILLAPQLSDPQGTFQRWLDTGREIYVNLDEPVMVHLTYRTAWVDEDGRDQFREDKYGRDATVWSALEAKGLAPVL